MASFSYSNYYQTINVLVTCEERSNMDAIREQLGLTDDDTVHVTPETGLELWCEGVKVAEGFETVIDAMLWICQNVCPSWANEHWNGTSFSFYNEKTNERKFFVVLPS